MKIKKTNSLLYKTQQLMLAIVIIWIIAAQFVNPGTVASLASTALVALAIPLILGVRREKKQVNTEKFGAKKATRREVVIGIAIMTALIAGYSILQVLSKQDPDSTTALYVFVLVVLLFVSPIVGLYLLIKHGRKAMQARQPGNEGISLGSIVKIVIGGALIATFAWFLIGQYS